MPRATPIVIDWRPDRGAATPVTEQIVQHMCRQVSTGAWPIGARLPSQRAMAEAFGVNRSTIIAAVNELADYGIVEGLRGAGTRIVSNTWSLMLPGSPDWADYVSSGFFRANNETIQTINRLEFDPSMARLGTGELDPRLFPRDMWRAVLSEAADGITSMGYPEPEGIPELREAIAAHMRGLGVEAAPGQILVTSGALQALQIISVSLLSAGSTVFAEAPSYIKSLQVFQSAGMRLAGVRMDGGGIDVDALREAIGGIGGIGGPDDAPAPVGRGPRRRGGGAVLYTIPTNHNPTGVTMDADRRRELLACCVERRLPIIEDGAYQDLVFDGGPAPAPLKSMDETGMVIHLGSASKALAPGLRIGWIVAPEPIVHRLADVKMQMDYGASRLSQWVFARFLASGMYDGFLGGLRVELRRRRDAALATLDRLFGGVARWNRPVGGFYIWLTFDRQMPMNRLFARAAEAGVLLNPGDIYDFEADNSLRLSYAYATPDEFAAAADRLADVVRALG